MLERLSPNLQRQRSTFNSLARGVLGPLRLAVAVGVAYFVAAQLSLALLLKPDGVAVFWPAAGISSGVLISLGASARWPVVLGTMAATVVANLTGDRSGWAAASFALCNAVEALVTAGLIHRYFGEDFGLDRIRQVLGLLAAAVAGTVISGIGGAIAYKLFHSPMVPFLTTWRHWVASDAVGIIAVAPLVIGLGAVVRDRPPRSEFIEGIAALVALAVVTGFIISLPEQPWETVVPGALLFPMLLWLAARCRPVFAAGGAFLVSVMVVWTATFHIGHFGDARLPMDSRLLQAQAVILVVTLGAFVLAALFAERRKHETQLTYANKLLERERDHKLMNFQVIGASIAHEMKQPLTAIAANGQSALAFLERDPPDLAQAGASLADIVDDSRRASEALDGIRNLFRKSDDGRHPVDVNEIIREVIQSLRRELKEHGVAVFFVALTSNMPLVLGNRSQLQQVVLNLVHNALEAMDGTKDRDRILEVRTEHRDGDSIMVEVKDSGPGIDSIQLETIFDPFVTTKPEGMGLGLAICRMIIERHGGQLAASSDGKSGTAFQFVLPAKQTTKAADQPGRPIPANRL